MFMCDKYSHCIGCDYAYADRIEDFDEEFADCGHLIEVVPVECGRWIPVNGNPTPTFTNVMCFFPQKSYGSKIEVSYFESTSGVCADAFKYGAATHWMKLPKEPEEN